MALAVCTLSLSIIWTIGVGKTLHFAGREPVLVPGEGVKKLYFDVTSGDLAGQGLDCKLDFGIFIEPNGTGDLKVFYDKVGGEAKAASINLATKTQGSWTGISKNTNECAFNNGLNGGEKGTE